MILRKSDYYYARNVIKLWLELYPDEKRLDLARRLVHNTQAPVLIVDAILLEIGGHDKELYAEFISVSNYYRDTVE